MGTHPLLIYQSYTHHVIHFFIIFPHKIFFLFTRVIYIMRLLRQLIKLPVRYASNKTPPTSKTPLGTHDKQQAQPAVKAIRPQKVDQTPYGTDYSRAVVSDDIEPTNEGWRNTKT